MPKARLCRTAEILKLTRRCDILCQHALRRPCVVVDLCPCVAHLPPPLRRNQACLRIGIPQRTNSRTNLRTNDIMAESPPTTLNDLAAKITELTETLSRFLTDNSIPEPSFAADSPTSYTGLTAESFMVRQALFDALMDMIYLTQGPSESIFNFVHTCMPDAASLNVLNYFDFWAAVPLDGSASYDDIAKHTDLPREVVRRVIEHATTLRLFAPTEPGKAETRIRHTSRSAALSKNAGLRALVSTLLDDAGPPMTVLPEALRQYTTGKPELTTDMNETSFALFHRHGVFGEYATPWDLLENDGSGEKKGWRQRNFVEFMRYLKDIFQLEKVMLECYDWKAAGKATVVDVGGSAGHDSVVLAQNFPDLSITVQDLGQVKPAYEANVPQELKARVRFMEHSFFDPQPVRADVYLLKLILHDWPDAESIQILRGLVPAMKAGSRVIFIDYVGKHGDSEGAPLPRSIQAMGTATDMRMMALFNAKERPVEEWKGIFQAADSRFEIVRTKADPLTFMVVIEAVLRE
ncbi:6-hydroxytryprostatin B O-methyltransferase [Tolypocladium ophioglossoides CBS 100239]|uniref:6-hydroxytryprostatin B O-methyltransferase n=1 Tax=Tolypocladium ophioglossoides (strain CBS 100239) TaxID=1163406 RepID=A0A0L0NCQ4_TOLOC|nr:6-hydroxytryprostatin B O-methyltransferase [Tolypocladium ophioglossoides CBS 100239]